MTALERIPIRTQVRAAVQESLVRSELGADMAVHGEEVCPSHCKGICEIADTYIFKKTTIARIIQDI